MGGKSSDPQTVTQSVDIPDFLQPLAEQQAQVGQFSLGNLQQLLSGDLTAGFTPAQQQAFSMANQFATGQTPFLPTAQQTFLQTAQGQDLSSFLPTAALDTLTGAAGTSAVPTQAMDAAGNVINAELLPQATSEALTSTAQGDFLFGGQGFDQAVDAAVRAARPQIQSTFGRAGAGGATGGLAQAAIGQAAADAFARQFGQERQNQLSAAQALGGLTQAGRGQQLQAAGLLGDLGLSGQAQQLQAAGLLGDLASQERANQLQAAGVLPQLGMTGADILSRIGAQQQAQAQQEISAPIQAMQQLFGASGGGVPLGALLGQTQTVPTQSSPLLGGLGGALSGAQLGSVVPGLGTGIGAGLGALAGLLG